jgi:CheY-like chemotaxis protein
MNDPSSDSPPARPQTVLLVEDDHDVRVALRRLLEEARYEVWTAGDGRSAFAMLEHAATVPDVIVADLMMPVMDGWKLIDELKQHARFAEIPVIIQSAFRDPPPPHGIVGFLDKPIDEQALLRAIGRQLLRFMPSTDAR